MAYSRICVLLTVHNRRETTLRSLESIANQKMSSGDGISTYLVDDGSTDGTIEAVSSEFPEVRVLHGDGGLYWNGGMRKVFQAAMDDGYDAYIWVNDDCLFVPDALSRLLACAEQTAQNHGPSIVVGSMIDPRTGRRSYGGIKKREDGLHLRFDPVIPDEIAALPCDTMNGNFTLIPAAVAEVVGNLDGAFRHQLGDFDYGLRARKAGFPVFVAPGYYGECSDNDRAGSWRDRSISLRQRWAQLMSPKGAPVREWFLYTRRHFGWRWPLYAASPYLKCLFN